MKFIQFEDLDFKGRVVIVGGGPTVLDNEPGFIDDFDTVVRINNYKTFTETGYRTDVHYSYFGKAIRDQKDAKLCMCKYPNGDIKHIPVEWGDYKPPERGIDFTWVYRHRSRWWYTDTYIPLMKEFEPKFFLLNEHMPTTGFSAIYDFSKFDCEIYLTGFDFFESGKHNVNEKWRAGRHNDPIGHKPELEREWISANRGRFEFDRKLSLLL